MSLVARFDVFTRKVPCLGYVPALAGLSATDSILLQVLARGSRLTGMSIYSWSAGSCCGVAVRCCPAGFVYSLASFVLAMAVFVVGGHVYCQDESIVRGR